LTPRDRHIPSSQHFRVHQTRLRHPANGGSKFIRNAYSNLYCVVKKNPKRHHMNCCNENMKPASKYQTIRYRTRATECGKIQRPSANQHNKPLCRPQSNQITPPHMIKRFPSRFINFQPSFHND